MNSETVLERDKYERNVVHHAALNGALDTCKIVEDKFELLSLLTCDSDGRTPVHYAVNNAHSSVTNFLLEVKQRQNTEIINYRIICCV